MLVLPIVSPSQESLFPVSYSDLCEDGVAVKEGWKSFKDTMKLWTTAILYLILQQEF